MYCHMLECCVGEQRTGAMEIREHSQFICMVVTGLIQYIMQFTLLCWHILLEENNSNFCSFQLLIYKGHPSLNLYGQVSLDTCIQCMVKQAKFILDIEVYLTFNLLIMIVEPLQTAWNQTRRRVTLQAVCLSAIMSSNFK